LSVKLSPPILVRTSALPVAVVIPNPLEVVTVSGAPLSVWVVSTPAVPEQRYVPAPPSMT
jgi:hypothetical protein